MSELSLLLSLGGDSLMAVTSPLVVCLVGAYCFRSGFLPAASRKVVDKLIVEATMPCLIISQVMPKIDLERLVLIWPLVAMCLAMVVSGLVLGSVLSRMVSMVYPEASQHRGLIMVSLAFPNTFIIPLTMCLAMPGLPELLGLEDLGIHALQKELALFFILGYSIWVLAMWSIGYPILAGVLSFREWRQKALNPPALACLFSILVGLSWGYLNSAMNLDLSKLAPVLHAVDFAGQACVPLMLLNLGSRLSDSISEIRENMAAKSKAKMEAKAFVDLEAAFENPNKQEEDALDIPGEARSEISVCGSTAASSEESSSQAGNPAAAPAKASAIAATAAAEVPLPKVVYVLIPLFRQVFGSLLAATIAILVFRNACGITNKPLLLVSMLQGAGPPMINISVMTGISGSGEKEAAKVLLVTYSASLITWGASMAIFLYLLQ